MASDPKQFLRLGHMEAIDWDEFEDIARIPDFNTEPLNGESPDDILSRYDVYVEVLGPRSPAIRAFPIVVAGSGDAVENYIRHLQSTWAVEPAK